MTFWTGLTFAFNVAASTSRARMRIEVPIGRFQESERKALRRIPGIKMNQPTMYANRLLQLCMDHAAPLDSIFVGMETCPADEAGKEQGANPHRHGNSNRTDRSLGAGARERDSDV